MLKKPGIRKLFKIFKFNSHFHVTLTAGIITFHFNIRIACWIDDGENRFKLETIYRIAFECHCFHWCDGSSSTLRCSQNFWKHLNVLLLPSHQWKQRHSKAIRQIVYNLNRFSPSSIPTSNPDIKLKCNYSYSKCKMKMWRKFEDLK